MEGGREVSGKDGAESTSELSHDGGNDETVLLENLFNQLTMNM
jgi:hypothetical protein